MFLRAFSSVRAQPGNTKCPSMHSSTAEPVMAVTMLPDRHQQEQVCLRLACGVWALDFVQERLHRMSSGDSESTFTKAGDSETKEGLRLQGAIGEPRQCSASAP